VRTVGLIASQTSLCVDLQSGCWHAVGLVAAQTPVWRAVIRTAGVSALSCAAPGRPLQHVWRNFIGSSRSRRSNRTPLRCSAAARSLVLSAAPRSPSERPRSDQNDAPAAAVQDAARPEPNRRQPDRASQNERQDQKQASARESRYPQNERRDIGVSMHRGALPHRWVSLTTVTHLAATGRRDQRSRLGICEAQRRSTRCASANVAASHRAARQIQLSCTRSGAGWLALRLLPSFRRSTASSA
jgi:hypothetical protein